jgi:hypothetical protein
MTLHTLDEQPDGIEKSLKAQMGFVVQVLSDLKVLLANSCLYVPVGPITNCLANNYEDCVWCAPVYAGGEICSTTLAGNPGAKDVGKECVADDTVDVCFAGGGPSVIRTSRFDIVSCSCFANSWDDGG